MEGPYWVGERFVLPIDQELILGTETGNWLSLEGTILAKRHCRLLLTRNGLVDIQDLSSESGTWIGSQRIARGRLQPGESFRIGAYRFRLDYQASLGGETRTEEALQSEESDRLPVMETVVHDKSPGDRLVRTRFITSRRLILVFAWSVAAYHTCVLGTLPGPERWTWHGALIAGGVILIGLTISANRVTLAHRRLKFVTLGVLLTLAVVDLSWIWLLPAICGVLLASAIMLLLVGIPSGGRGLFGFIVGLGATGVMAVRALQIVMRTAAG